MPEKSERNSSESESGTNAVAHPNIPRITDAFRIAYESRYKSPTEAQYSDTHKEYVRKLLFAFGRHALPNRDGTAPSYRPLRRAILWPEIQSGKVTDESHCLNLSTFEKWMNGRSRMTVSGYFYIDRYVNFLDSERHLETIRRRFRKELLQIKKKNLATVFGSLSSEAFARAIIRPFENTLHVHMDESCKDVFILDVGRMEDTVVDVRLVHLDARCSDQAVWFTRPMAFDIIKDDDRFYEMLERCDTKRIHDGYVVSAVHRHAPPAGVAVSGDFSFICSARNSISKRTAGGTSDFPRAGCLHVQENQLILSRKRNMVLLPSLELKTSGGDEEVYEFLRLGPHATEMARSKLDEFDN